MRRCLRFDSIQCVQLTSNRNECGDCHAQQHSSLNLLLRSLTDVREERVVEGVKFFHHIGGVELPKDYVRNLVAKNEHGEDIREMEVVEWARKVGELAHASDYGGNVRDPGGCGES